MENQPSEAELKEPSREERLLLWKEMAAFALIPLAVCVYMAYVVAPIHWIFVRHHGPNFLWVQLLVLVVCAGIWTRVPPMPGLMQGVICIGGWLSIFAATIGWLPFALGVLAGFNGF
jgi:hypothetical protein